MENTIVIFTTRIILIIFRFKLVIILTISKSKYDKLKKYICLYLNVFFDK